MPDCELSTLEYPMTDEALQTAITETHVMLRRTGRDMGVFDDLKVHLRDLLVVQASRASVMGYKQESGQ